MGWSKAYLAREMGVSRSYVSHVEAGRKRNPLGFSLRLMAILDKENADYLHDLINESIQDKADSYVRRKK